MKQRTRSSLTSPIRKGSVSHLENVLNVLLSFSVTLASSLVCAKCTSCDAACLMALLFGSSCICADAADDRAERQKNAKTYK